MSDFDYLVETVRACLTIESIEFPPPSALDLLHAWVLRDPSFRVVERMARVDGAILIELRSKSGLHESRAQLDFDSAIRTAIMIAQHSGEK